MDNKNLVNTDSFCKSPEINKNRNRIDSKIKETKIVKKVGLPTLVTIFYIKEAVKKVGPSTLVNSNKKPSHKKTLNPIGLRKSIKFFLTIIVVLITQQLSKPYSKLITKFSQNIRGWPLTTWLSWTCPCSSTSSCGLSWTYSISTNKLLKMINGNRRLGYNLAMWNCRRGLICSNKEPSLKMIDVKTFLQQKKLHMLCLVEADLHGNISRYKRQNPLSTNDIHQH